MVIGGFDTERHHTHSNYLTPAFAGTETMFRQSRTITLLVNTEIKSIVNVTVENIDLPVGVPSGQVSCYGTLNPLKFHVLTG
jgi:hypothetical protein